MTSEGRASVGPGWCDACMSSRRCWVCDGEGAVDARAGFAECPSCGGTGICRHCSAAALTGD